MTNPHAIGYLKEQVLALPDADLMELSTSVKTELVKRAILPFVQKAESVAETKAERGQAQGKQGHVTILKLRLWLKKPYDELKESLSGGARSQFEDHIHQLMTSYGVTEDKSYSIAFGDKEMGNSMEITFVSNDTNEIAQIKGKLDAAMTAINDDIPKYAAGRPR